MQNNLQLGIADEQSEILEIDQGFQALWIRSKQKI